MTDSSRDSCEVPRASRASLLCFEKAPGVHDSRNKQKINRVTVTKDGGKNIEKAKQKLYTEGDAARTCRYNRIKFTA